LNFLRPILDHLGRRRHHPLRMEILLMRDTLYRLEILVLLLRLHLLFDYCSFFHHLRLIRH
jgi:hypothetical protein